MTSTSPSLSSVMDSPLLSRIGHDLDVEECPSSPSSPPRLASTSLLEPTTQPQQPVLRRISSQEELDMAEEQAPSLHSPVATAASPSRFCLLYDKIHYLWNQRPTGLADGQWQLVVALLVWYLVGLLAIVTTKLLLTEWQIPPLLLTFQQFIVASHLLKLHLRLFTKDGIAPWPWTKDKQAPLLLGNTSETTVGPTGSMDFVLTGLFNSLDLLASNVAFSASAASFVETIKSADPISTTAVALIWKVDRLETDEGICLFVLVMGMLLSTWGNASGEESTMALAESTQAAATVMAANVCFAFRAMSQKKYRRHAADPMNDENLLAKMFQVGWMVLGVPCMVYYYNDVRVALETPLNVQLQYLKLASVNAVSFATYNLASTYVLSKLTVLHHSTLGCLRRMFVVIGTCIFFGVPMTGIGAIGLLTSFAGFCGFTFYRAQRKRREEKSDV